MQRIAATLAEESAPTESDMRREGMLYRYLRDYTPNSPMNSPLDAIPYDLYADEEIIDTQPWWSEQSNNNPPSHRESSPSVDAMETSAPSTRGHSVPPISIPENRRLSTTAIINSSEHMHISPTNTMGTMLPPMVPQLARMKRKGTPCPGTKLTIATSDHGFDAATAIKRRAIDVSPSSSPLLSPIAIGSGIRERRVLNLQDTHNVLEKMSLQD